MQHTLHVMLKKAEFLNLIFNLLDAIFQLLLTDALTFLWLIFIDLGESLQFLDINLCIHNLSLKLILNLASLLFLLNLLISLLYQPGDLTIHIFHSLDYFRVSINHFL